MISALGRYTESHYTLVRITTDAGIEGAGEATVAPRWSGETAVGAQDIIDTVFTPLIVGCDPRDIDEIDRRMESAAWGNWFAKSAIEMACWDIAGKDAGKPIYEMLGGAARPLAIRCRFSMGAYSAERAEQRARELVQEGFTTIKVKVGTKPEEDIERVRTVRKAAGPGPDIVIDANCGFDVRTAIEVANTLRDCRIDLFEQPTPRGDFAGLAEVRKNIEPKVMADDMCFDLSDARECVRHNACDVISVYPGKNGGIARTKRIVDYAGEHGIACSIGSNLELDVASAAMCHAVVACPNMTIERFPGDILGPDYHEVSVVKNPLKIAGPVITLPSRPGLGVDVDWSVVEKYRA